MTRDQLRHPQQVRLDYWREVGRRAWIRSLRKSCRGTLATGALVCAILAISIGVVTGIVSNALVGVGLAFVTALGWTVLFFAVNLVAVPARIHADLVAQLETAREELRAARDELAEAREVIRAAREEIRSYNAVVDRRMVRNLLLRMREKCLAYRNNQVTVSDQVRWANELLATLSTLYGAEIEVTLRRELPYLLDIKASARTMDFYMRHLADKLLARTEEVGLDIYSMKKTDLNRFVRKRLMSLQNEQPPGSYHPRGPTA